ncbi:unnamed protein product, partial [Amoebophrya sp. A120]
GATQCRALVATLFGTIPLGAARLSWLGAMIGVANYATWQLAELARCARGAMTNLRRARAPSQRAASGEPEAVALQGPAEGGRARQFGGPPLATRYRPANGRARKQFGGGGPGSQWATGKSGVAMRRRVPGHVCSAVGLARLAVCPTAARSVPAEAPSECSGGWAPAGRGRGRAPACVPAFPDPAKHLPRPASKFWRWQGACFGRAAFPAGAAFCGTPRPCLLLRPPSGDTCGAPPLPALAFSTSPAGRSVALIHLASPLPPALGPC